MLAKKMLYRFSLVFLILSFFCSVFNTDTVYAEDWVEISSASEFNNIRLDGSLNYRLMDNIDLTDYPNWIPIGTDASPFTGKLDGNGKVISGLKLTDTTGSSQGLFGNISSTAWITNLTIHEAAVTAGSYTGILVGKNAGNVTNCNVSGSISGENYVGGLAGQNTGTINQSYSTATVTGKGYVGGLVGSNSSTISESYAASPVLASVFNNYIQFDGTDDYIKIPHIVQYQTASFTLEAWFQWDPAYIGNGSENNDADVQFIVGKGFEQFEIHTEGGSGENGIRFIPIPRSTIVGETPDAYHDVLDVIQPGWFHVASSWDFNTKTVRVYVNGVQQEIYHWNTAMTERTSAGLTASVNLKDPETNPFATNIYPLLIGARSNTIIDGEPDMYFKGKIADVRFWNIVRDGESIDTDKNKQLSGNEPGLMGYWKLNEADGTKALDSSTNHNDGDLMNGASRVQEGITNVGGLVGEDLSDNGITDSYYDNEVSGMSDIGKGVGKTTEEMKTLTTFSSWDFVNTWKMTEDVTYPTFIRYTLNYSAGTNGTIDGISTQLVNPGGFGSEVTADPSTGYHFVQWSDDSTQNPRTDLNVLQDLSVTASFAANEITVNFDAEGGTVDPTSQTKLFGSTYGKGSDGTTSDELPTPVLTNYRFDGWYDGDNGTGNLVSDATSVSNATTPHTLYAKWVRQYTLTYTAGANGSLTGVTSQTVDTGTSGTAVTAVPSSGYHFVNWSDGVETATRTDLTVEAVINVTANFAANEITVNFDAEGGTVDPISQTKLFDSTYGKGSDGSTSEELPTPTLANHRFDGWYDGDNGTGNLVTDATTVNNAATPHTLYAKWVRQYTLTYAAGENGSLTGVTSQTVDTGSDGTAVTAVPSSGYHFVSWSDGVETATRTDLTVEAVINVTASFAPNQITVNFDAEGGTVDPTSQTKLFDSTYGKGSDGSTSEELPTPTLANHRFDGWYDGDNGTGNLVTDATAVSTATPHILYAKWVRQYTLTYAAGENGSLTGDTSQTVDTGSNGTAVTADPSTGYHFVQWSDESTQNPRTDMNVLQDLSVTASFAPNQITVNFDAEGGTVDPTSQTKLFGSTYGKGSDGTTSDELPTPTLTSYRFDGWYDGDNGTGNLVSNATTVSNAATPHTLYAKWVRQYTLTYAAGENGSLTGVTSQTVDTGSDGTAVTAVPSTGYHFVKWSDDNTENPRTDLTVETDIDVTASFEPNQITVNFDAEGGTVDPISQTKLFGSTYGMGSDGITDERLPIPSRLNFSFGGWYDGDEGTGNLITMTSVISNPENHTLYALWIPQYILTYIAGENGSIQSGENSIQIVDEGQNGVSVTAVPDPGYHFVKWSDDVMTATRTDLNIRGNLTVTAIFDQTIYTYYFPLILFNQP